MLKKLFQDILLYKKDFLQNVNSGNDFEKKIEWYLEKILFLRKISTTKFNQSNKKELKKIIQNKLDIEHKIPNTHWQHLSGWFISQPFWTQSYPDFIIFTDKYIYVLEIKFSNSDNSRPMWNSGFPLTNWIYIFWWKVQQDITFFLGKDVLSNEERAIMIHFFEELKLLETQVNNQLAKYNKHKAWFQVYIRKAFQQKKVSNDTEMSFFNNTQRKKREMNVLNYVSE